MENPSIRFLATAALVLLAAIGVATFIPQQRPPGVRSGLSSAPGKPPATKVAGAGPAAMAGKAAEVGDGALAAGSRDAKVPAATAMGTLPAPTPAPPAREPDIRVNPYAGALREPGKSKRSWDPAYIESFMRAEAGDSVRFELTGGVMAEGNVRMVRYADGGVSYVSGELTAPETGTFFILRPPAGGKAGTAVAVVEFPGSKTAYRVEPTGPGGAPELWQRRLDEVICLSMPEADPELLEAEEAMAAEAGGSPETIVPLRPDQVPDVVPSYNAGIVSLQSYPGSLAVLLLDFAGGHTDSWGGVTYPRPAVDNNTIKDVWKRVAEDFMPFNINVTTDSKVFQAAPAASRMRCVMGTTQAAGSGGVAYVGSWNWGNDTVCWSLYSSGKAAAEVAAHEPGHTLGLVHQGREIPNGSGGITHEEYYGGQGSGETAWAPIMGVGYDKPVSTWAKGEYQYANQHEDALRIITTSNNNVDYRTDDTGNTLATSRCLEISTTTNNAMAEGVIEQSGDTDAFRFTTTGGAVSLTASPVGDWADLALSATLADATDTVVATSNAPGSLSATISTTLAAGTYTFRVTGVGKNDPLTIGFSSYGSLGYYSIFGSVAGAGKPTLLSVAQHAAVNTVVGTVPAANPNASPLVYSIVGGNAGATFTVDNNGVLRVANNSLLDYAALVANPSLYAARLELFVNITNTNNPAYNETNRRVLVEVVKFHPPVPANPTAGPDTCSRIRISWGEVSDAASFNIKRATAPGGPYTTVGTAGGSTFSDAGVTIGTTYYYVVSAVNEYGESANSAEVSAMAQALAGFSFESPATTGYTYNPSGGIWTFSGAPGTGSGVLTNGSGFGNPNASDGTQAAFVQGAGTITQTLSGFVPGTSYVLSYRAAQRAGTLGNGGQTWNATLDGAVIQTNTPGGTGYAVYTASFTATATYHTLAFVGTNLSGGDNTVFIDHITIVSSPQPVAASVALTSPGNGASYLNTATVNLTAEVAAHGNLVTGVEFYADNSLLGTAATAPYTFAWSGAGAGWHTVHARVLFNNGSDADSPPARIAILNANQNLSFESPGLGSGFQYGPSGGSWTFGGGSGIVANGSAFGNPNAPAGSQAALLQGYGKFSQLLSGFVPGTVYSITYSAAQRAASLGNGGESWDVAIDGNVIQSNSPGTAGYASYSATFTASAASHTMSFVGTNLAFGDNTVFIDNLAINALGLIARTVHQGTDEIVTFTSGSGTWTPPAGVTSVQVLAVGGGGGGGRFGGGGGAGGFRTSTVPVTPATGYTVTVGAGGTGSSSQGAAGDNGVSSVFGALTAVGGGGGGSRTANAGSPGINGVAGGSGGGASASDTGSKTGGAGTSGQGNAGGAVTAQCWGSGGGGGAGTPGGSAAGSNASGVGGNGGNGLSSAISGITVWYAGGGGGGSYSVAGAAGTGGLGGGGDGTRVDAANGTAGTANSGGGGGGGGLNATGGTGGSGVVIVRYSYGASPRALSWFSPVSAAWSGGNWTDGTFASMPVSAGQTDYTLNFNNTGTYTATNDLNSGFLLNRLNFGGPVLTLAGNSLAFAGTSPQVNQNSAVAVTVGNDLVLNADTTFGGTGTGIVTLDGAISGTGSLTQAGTGTLVLAGNNTYGGGTSVSAGTLKLQAPPSVTGINYFKVTGDSNSGISTANTFTHTINPSGGSEVVNGVPFTGAATGTLDAGSLTAKTYTQAGGTVTIANSIGNSLFGGTAIGTNLSGWSGVSGNLLNLFSHFNYNSAPTRKVVLTGLAPNTWYDVRLFEKQWDTSTGRTFSVAYDVGNDGSVEYTSPTIDQNHPESTAALSALGITQQSAWVQSYIYKTGAGQTSIALTITNSTSATYHFYGISNQLVAAGNLSANSSIAIAAGATLDVSDIPLYSFGTGASLTASGTGSSPATIIGGTTVDLGSQAVTLNLTPTSFNGDTANPALVVSQGALTLNGAISVHIGGSTPLRTGTYRLISQASGSISGAPTLAAITGPGSNNGLGSNQAAALQVSGGEVNLVVTSTLIAPTVTLTRHSGTAASTTYGDSLSFDVAVTPNSPTAPTGQVTLKDGGTIIGSYTLFAGGNGTCTITPALNALAAGSHANIVAEYAGDANFDFGASAALGTQTVAPKALTIAGAAAAMKMFDGTTTATLSGTLSAGVLSGDTVTLNLAGHFASAAAGVQSVVFTSTLGGALQANYTLTQPTTVTAQILAGPTWTGLGADSHWNTSNNWVFGTVAGNGQAVYFDANTVNGTVLLDNFQATGNLNLNSGLTTNITINPSFPWLITSDHVINIAAGSKDLTINAERYVLWGSGATWNIGAGRTLTVNSGMDDDRNVGGLTMNGPGTAILTGANSYPGGTSLNGGTLQINNAAALGSGNITFGGGTLKYGTGITSDLANRFKNSTGAVAIDTNDNNLTFAGAVDSSNTGGLTKTGTGTLTLTTASVYTGATTINGGTVKLQGSASVAVSNNSFEAPAIGGTYAENTMPTSWTGGSPGIARAGGPYFTPGSAPDGAQGAFTKGGGSSLSQTIVFANSATYTLSFHAVGRAGYSTPFTVSLGGTVLDTITPSTSVWTKYTKTVALTAGSRALTFANVNSGDVSVNFDNVAITYPTTAANYLPTATALAIGSGGTLDLCGGSQTVASLADGTGGGSITNTSATASTLTLNPGSGSTTFGGVIGGGGAISLVKTGGGTQVLSGTNTYSGETTLSGGTLALAGGSINNSSAVTIAAGATFDVSSVAAYTLSNNTTLKAAGTATPATLKGAVGGTVGLGSRPITLTYDGTHPALTVSQGVLSLSGNSFTVNGPTLALGTYTLVAQTNGTITTAGTYPDATGTAIPSGMRGVVSVSGNTVLLTIAPNTPNIASWINGFNWAGFTNPDKSATGDPDHDGLTNFTEYAFSLDPTTGTGVPPVTAPDRTSGTFTYTRRDPALTGLSYTYQYSTTLTGAWTSVTPALPDIVTAGADNTQTVTVNLTGAPGNPLANAKLFIRVVASGP